MLAFANAYAAQQNAGSAAALAAAQEEVTTVEAEAAQDNTDTLDALNAGLATATTLPAAQATGGGTNASPATGRDRPPGADAPSRLSCRRGVDHDRRRHRQIASPLVTLGALAIQALLTGAAGSTAAARPRSGARPSDLETVCAGRWLRHDDELKEVRDLAIKATTTLQNHVDQCGDRYDVLEKAVNRVHDRIDEVFRSLGNLATGRTAMYRVSAARPPPEAGTKEG